MRDYWAEYCQHSTTTHPYNENDDTVPLRYDETGYEHFLLVNSPMVHLPAATVTAPVTVSYTLSDLPLA